MPKLAATSPLVAVLRIHPIEPDILYVPKRLPTMTAPAKSIANAGVIVVAAARRVYHSIPSSIN